MALKTKDFAGTYTSGTGVVYTYILRVIENSVSTLENSSNITVKAILKDNTTTGITFTTWGTGVSCSLNDKEIFNEYKQRDYYGPGENVFYTWTGNVAHNADGTLRLKVEGRLWQNSPANWSPAKITITESDSMHMDLTAIARESTIGATDAYIGAATTISVNRKNAGYSHAICLEFGDIKGYIDSEWKISTEQVNLTASSISFKLTEDFYYQIKELNKRECTLTVTTYDGTTQVGKPQTATFMVLADPEKCSPTVTGTVTDVNETTKALTGDEKTLVKFFSIARCSIKVNPKYEATITQRMINGKELGADETLDIEGVETTAISFRAVDSRGFPGSDTDEDLVMVPYVRLTNQATCKRTDPTSGKAVLHFEGDWFNGSFGAKSNALTLTYRIDGGDEVVVQPQLDGNEYEASVDLTDLNYLESHTVTVTVKDKLDDASKDLTVPKGLPVFDWGETDFQFHVPVFADSFNGSFNGGFNGNFNGVYMCSKYISSTAAIRIKTKYADFNGADGNRQSIFLFGTANKTPVFGVGYVSSSGEVKWEGTSGVVLTAEGDSILVITLPTTAYDMFTAISADPISFV